jgi:hypothetical protein
MIQSEDTMCKKVIVYSLIIAISISAFAQSSDPVVLSYQRNFIRASISTKIELLNDASRITTISMAPLYIDAIRFVTTQYPILGSDAQLIEIGAVAAAKSSQYQDLSILGPVKELFTAVPDSRVRTACLNTLASVSKGRKDEVEFINGWFSETLRTARSGKTTDVRVLSAAAEREERVLVVIRGAFRGGHLKRRLKRRASLCERPQRGFRGLYRQYPGHYQRKGHKRDVRGLFFLAEKGLAD